MSPNLNIKIPCFSFFFFEGVTSTAQSSDSIETSIAFILLIKFAKRKNCSVKYFSSLTKIETIIHSNKATIK